MFKFEYRRLRRLPFSRIVVYRLHWWDRRRFEEESACGMSGICSRPNVLSGSAPSTRLNGIVAEVAEGSRQ